MKLVLTESRLLKEGVNILSELVSDVKIKLDPDKLEIIAMDPANVAMVVFRLLNSAFIEYDIKGCDVISINLDSLKHVLGRSKPLDKVVLELDNEKNRLKISLLGDSKRTFNLGLIDIHERDQKIPELNFDGNIEMDSASFNDAIEDMGIISDSVSLNMTNTSFLVSTMGNISDAKVEFSNGDGVSVVLDDSKEEISSKYSVAYLKKILKGGKLSDRVFLKFGQDYPLQIEYKVTDKLHFMTLLAPRVSND